MSRWICMGLLAPALAWASPVQLQQAGRLLDQDGTPIESPTVLQFSLYAAASGGSALWTEDLTVDPDSGFYAVVLGADTGSNPLDSSTFDGSERFVSIARVDGGSVTPLGSRQRLGAVPHAIHALQADRATVADSALTADSAATADSALSADYATAAGQADNALTADFALTAGEADTAIAAETALFASSASTADSALIADSALVADSAANALTADYATAAGSADTATTADSALSADSAAMADDALLLGGRSLGAIEAQARSNGNLNTNPCFQQGFEHYSLYAGAGNVVSSASSMCGTTAYENASNASTWIHSSELVPLDRAGIYEVSGSFRRTETTGSSGTYFLAVLLYDSNGTRINGDGTWWYYPVSGATLTDTNWSSHSALFGLGTDQPFPADASFMSVGAILNYNGTSGGRTYQVTGLGIQRLSGPGTWNTPAYENGWGNYGNSYGPPGYTRDSSGVVHLRGLVAGGTASSGTVVFTLPEGYRPSSRRLFNCVTDSPTPGDSGDHARCDVLPDGRLLVYNVSNAWVSLDGIQFPTW